MDNTGNNINQNNEIQNTTVENAGQNQMNNAMQPEGVANQPAMNNGGNFYQPNNMFQNNTAISNVYYKSQNGNVQEQTNEEFINSIMNSNTNNMAQVAPQQVAPEENAPEQPVELQDSYIFNNDISGDGSAPSAEEVAVAPTMDTAPAPVAEAPTLTTPVVEPAPVQEPVQPAAPVVETPVAPATEVAPVQEPVVPVAPQPVMEPEPVQPAVPITNVAPAQPLMNSAVNNQAGFNATEQTAHVSLDTRGQEPTVSAVDDVPELDDEELEDVEYLEYEYGYANVFKRICADIIDQVIVVIMVCAMYIALSTLLMFIGSTVISVILSVITIIALSFGNLIYRTTNEKTGNTVGRRLTKTIVLTDEHENISITTALLRTIVASMINGTGIGFIVNTILICTDKNRKGIEDRLFKTEVIDSSI